MDYFSLYVGYYEEGRLLTHSCPRESRPINQSTSHKIHRKDIKMKRTRPQEIIALSCYIALTVLSGIATILCCIFIASLKNETPEGWEALGVGISIAIFLIFAFIALAVMLISLIPLIFKSISIRSRRSGFTVVCVVFDILMLLATGAVMIVSLSDAARILLLPIGIVGALYLTALISNIIYLKRSA